MHLYYTQILLEPREALWLVTNRRFSQTLLFKFIVLSLILEKWFLHNSFFFLGEKERVLKTSLFLVLHWRYSKALLDIHYCKFLLKKKHFSLSPYVCVKKYLVFLKKKKKHWRYGMSPWNRISWKDPQGFSINGPKAHMKWKEVVWTAQTRKLCGRNWGEVGR